MTPEIAAIPLGVVIETETEFYADWQCSVCRTWRHRTYPATVVTQRSGTTVMCREHDLDDEDDECDCHCHEDICDRCGELTGIK